jgi:hypothetical protein
MAWVPAHCALIERLKKSQIVGANPPLNGKAFWFAYFWEECGEKDFLQPVRDQIARMWNTMFQLPAQWDHTDPNCAFTITARSTISWKPGRNAASVDLPLNTSLTLLTPNAWDNVADADLLAVLNQLLRSGFIRVPAAAGTQSPDSALDVFRSALVGAMGGVAYKLGWRGDSRSVDQIKDAGGLINKAESLRYADSVNLTKPWHPFSQQQNRTDYFYRKNKEDNCLATVVSISTNFKTSAVFPLLNGDYISNLPNALPRVGTRFDTISPRDRRILHMVCDNTGPRMVRVADAQQLYLVALGENYFDTREAQARRQGESQAFPEFAVKSVPETGVLGCVKFVRVHHGLDEHGGLTVLADRPRSIAPTLDGCRRFCQNERSAKTMFPAVLEMYNDALSAMPFHVKWLPTGHSDVPLPNGDDNQPLPNILLVKDLFGKKLWSS